MVLFQEAYPNFDCIRAVTHTPAKMLGYNDLGHLQVGAKSDFIVVDSSVNTIFPLKRHAIQLIVKAGIPQIGAAQLMEQFPTKSVEIMLDGEPKFMNQILARQVTKCSLQEAGLEILEAPQKRFFWF
jgi:cytosine/adenosine deaminase-related metal-dependent hydrolase